MEKLDLSWLKIPELDKINLMKRTEWDRNFALNFGRDLSKAFQDKLRFQYEHKQNYIIDIFGESGSTKSYAAISLAGQSPSPPVIEQIFFRLDDLNKYMPKLDQGATIIMDERVQVYGVGRQRLDAEYTLMMETLRKKQINFWIVSPLVRAKEHAFFLIRALRLTDYKTISYVELDNTMLECMGHLKIPHPEKIVGKKFVKAYEDKKDSFLATVLKKKSTDYLSAFAYEVIDSKPFTDLETLLKEKARKKKKMFSGIPHKLLMELANAKFPNLRRNIEVRTIVDKIHYEGISKRGWTG